MIRNLVVRLMIGLMVWMPAQFATAGMIGTDAVASVDRTAVVSKLEAFGIDPLQAQDRVGAMTEEEVQTLANRLESLPAGQAQDVLAAVFIIGVIVAIIWWNVKR
jgi:hypothetical protein